MKEDWRLVPNFEGRYMASNTGKVKSLNYNRTGKPKLMGQFPDKDGYKHCKLFRNKKSKCYQVHYIVMLAFVGDRPNGMQINHKNGIKDDNRIENLEYCTPSENTKHSFDNGFQVAKRGSESPVSKLTEEQVIEIRDLAEKGDIPQHEIGDMFGVTQQTVSRLKSKSDWAHI